MRGVSAWAPPWSDILVWIRQSAEHEGRRLGLGPAEIDDLRQDMFIRVRRSIHRFDPDDGRATLRTWVSRYLVGESKDYWRRRSRGPQTRDALDDRVDDSSASPSHRAHQSELSAALGDCLQQLTDLQRERVLAAYDARQDGTPQYVIAASLGISRDSFKESLAAARRALRLCLSSRGFAPDGATRAAAPERGN